MSMEQIEQLKKNNKDLKKALDKVNGKYSKATQELTAAKLEIEHLTRVRDILKNAEVLRSKRAWINTPVSILIGVAVGMIFMWGVGHVQ